MAKKRSRRKTRLQFKPDWLASEVDPGTWRRGQAYFQEGRAEVLEVFENRQSVSILSECHGSEYYPYEQEILITSHRHGLSLTGHCDCPVGFNCKHVVAAVLEWQRQIGAQPAETADLLDVWLDELHGREANKNHTAREDLLYLLTWSRAEPVVLQPRFVVARAKPGGGWYEGRSTVPANLTGTQTRRPAYQTASDEQILGLIKASVPSHSVGGGYQLTGVSGGLALQLMLETERCFLGDDTDQLLRSGPPRHLEIKWVKDRQAFRCVLSLNEGGQLLAVDPPCYLDRDQGLVGQVVVPENLNRDDLAILQSAPAIPLKRAAAVAKALALKAPSLPSPVEIERQEVRLAPIPALSIDFDPRVPQFAAAQANFIYGDERLPPGTAELVIREADTKVMFIHRDLEAESSALAQLEQHGLVSVDGEVNSFVQPGWLADSALRAKWFQWIEEAVPQLQQLGWQIEQVTAPGVTLSHAADIHGEIEETSNDWFSLRFDLEIDGERMPLLPLVSELLREYQPGQLPPTLYLNAGRGHFVAVPSERIEPILTTIIELFDQFDGENLELPRPDIGRLSDLDRIPIQGSTSLLKLAAKLRDFSGLERVKLPTTFKGELRDYQQQGVNWLQFLRSHGFGGILADDMGLGKTIQTLAHLAVEKRSGRMQNPCLIVAPTSLMSNWQREAAKFTPRLKVLILQGPQRSARFGQIKQADLVLTTYPLLPRDREVLLKQRWHFLILDEAQQIKNPKAQAAQVARRLQAEHRLCLTGTPMENHLSELWAQFDFLMPGFLGEHQHFRRQYRTPIEDHGDEEKLLRLTRRTAPFLLRRTKDRVADELPPKTELLRGVALGPRQAMLYESVRLTMEKKVRDSIARRGLARSHIIVLEALLKLRQVCCDPRLLLSGTRGAKAAGSAKFELLFDLLPELIDEGRRVLLFSQFTTMLGLIEAEVKQRGIAYTKLTGQTRKRDAAIECFRSGQANLFLISLKAGGVGLNLTEADTVIHYDPWWNPAVEHQATDRAHRIGQDKPVFVYKLVAEGTVEEKILALQERKQNLADRVHGKGRGHDQPPIDEATIKDLLAAV